MLREDAENKWVAELERRKRKIVEESQNRLNNFNAFRRSLLIFSHIFRITPKLKCLPKKRTRRRLKHRAICLDQKYVSEVKSEQLNANVKDPKSILPFELFHNHKSRYAERRVPDEILGSYLEKLRNQK